MNSSDDTTTVAMILLTVPLPLIILAIPLIFGKVGRNGIYGFRTPMTLSSDAVWYPANRAAGKSLLVAGVINFVLDLLAVLKISRLSAAALVSVLVGSLLIAVGYAAVRLKQLSRGASARRANGDSLRRE